MIQQSITNEMLYELLKEFKKDVNKQIDRIEENQREDHHMIMDIWRSRDKVQAQISWDFI